MPIYSYGTMVALGFFIAFMLILRRAKDLQISADFISDLFLVILISSIVGARLLYVLVNGAYFLRNPLEIIMVHHGGLILYGGVISAVAASYFFITKRGYAFYAIGDLFIPYLALGQAFGRMGCYLNGCCFGTVTDSACGVVFPLNSLPYQDHVEKGIIRLDSHFSLPVHPVQLYSALLDVIIFMVLLSVDRKKKLRGQTFWLYFILYPVKRFLMELLRDDTAAVFMSLTLYQVISAGLLVFGAAGYLIVTRSGNRRPEQA
jgi:phosphatidylglycerol:prolipoprotein diacylglycerol transferase